MKQLLTACFTLVLLPAAVCGHAQETAKANQPALSGSSRSQASAGMQGAYSMLMQIINDGTRDSMLNVQQFKIYTDRHFMYAHALPGDSLAYYGVGTYRTEAGRLMEYPFYTSEAGDQKDTFDIRITRLGNGYVQVINFPRDSLGRAYVLTEEYGNVSNNTFASPLDGAWKQTKSQFVPKTGAPTTNSNYTQFKVFQSGHFMWAGTQDSAGKRASYFGYGTFQMDGRNKLRERTTNSTFRTTLIGKPVTVQLEFMGTDAYRQTIQWPEGKDIEEYERLK